MKFIIVQRCYVILKDYDNLKQRSIHRLPIMYMVSVFLLFLYTFFIELSMLIDKIDSMRTIADIFQHSCMGEYINRKERKNL